MAVRAVVTFGRSRCVQLETAASGPRSSRAGVVPGVITDVSDSLHKLPPFVDDNGLLDI